MKKVEKLIERFRGHKFSNNKEIEYWLQNNIRILLIEERNDAITMVYNKFIDIIDKSKIEKDENY